MSAAGGKADIGSKEKSMPPFSQARGQRKKKGPRWWEIQRGPKSEELGARSERQRQAQPMAEAFAPAPLNITLARRRRDHYDPHATVEK